MTLVVAKFGGTGLANDGQFKKVYDIIQTDPNKKYIVPSAPGKVNNQDIKITGLLYLLYDLPSHGISYDEAFSIFKNRYIGICRGIGVGINLQDYFDEIRQATEEKVSKEYLSNRGEYLNGPILAKYLDIPFVDIKNAMLSKAPHVLGDQRTYKTLEEMKKSFDAAVIPGFYRSLPDGSIITLSRGRGSLSGAIVARGVGADLYENWTNVSGFLAADPKVIPHPRRTKEISYWELRELPYTGASILHEEAIFPVTSQGIPISTKNTNTPKEEGIRIIPSSRGGSEKNEITGIAGRQGFSVINIDKIQTNWDLSFSRKVLSILEASDIYVEHVPSNIDSLSLIVFDDQLQGKKKRITNEIKALCNPDSISMETDISLTAAVGQNMCNHIGASAKLFKVLADAQVNVEVITQGSSELNIIVGADTADCGTAIKVIYQAFNQD